MNEPRSFTDIEAARLSKLYEQAEKEILKQINIYIASGRAPGTTRNLRKLLNNVQQIRADLLRGARTWTQTSIPKTYQKGMDWADSGVPEGSPIRPGFFAVHQQAQLQLANELMGRLNEVDQTIDNSVRTVARRVDDIFRERQLEAARPAVTGYKTSRQQAKALQKDLAERGVCGFVDRAGREWSLKNYSRMAAITVTNNTLREGTKNRLVERGYDLCRISVHSKPCHACEKWQGQTLSISGNDPDYPALAEATGGGLFHPRCKHAMSLSPVEKDRFLGKLQGKYGEDVRNAEILRLARKGGWTG